MPHETVDGSVIMAQATRLPPSYGPLLAPSTGSLSRVAEAMQNVEAGVAHIGHWALTAGWASDTGDIARRTRAAPAEAASSFMVGLGGC